MLGLMCLANPKKAVRYAIICTIASVAGGMLGYLIGFFLYESVGLALLGALGLTDAFPPAACYLREYGAEIILLKGATRSEENTSELQSLMRISYDVFCLKKQKHTKTSRI